MKWTTSARNRFAGFLVFGVSIGLAQSSQPATKPGSQPASQPATRLASQPVIQSLFRATSQPASKPGVRTACYLGESVVTQPNGAPVGTMVVALRREYSQPESLITETIIIVHPKDATREETTIYKVDGNKVTAAPGGKWSVEGELAGPAWTWTGMKYLFKLNNNGGSVRGEETVDEGGLRDQRLFLRPDGAVQVHIQDTLHRISPEAFELLRKRLLTERPEPASQPSSSRG